MKKIELINKAMELCFEDIGFTSAESFESQKEILTSRIDEYSWLLSKGTDIFNGVDPSSWVTVLSGAKNLIGFCFT